MRFLVISTPTHQVPLEDLPGVLAAEREWRERHREHLVVYGWFAEGGGFGVVDVPDLETLSRINREHPFAYFSDTPIKPVIDADVASDQLRALLEERVGQNLT